MGYVIMKGQRYIARQGSQHIYTSGLQHARVFVSREAAEQHRSDDETIVPTELSPTPCPYCAARECRH